MPSVIPTGFTYDHDLQARICLCMAVCNNRLHFEEHVLTCHPRGCRYLARHGADPLTALDLVEWIAARQLGKEWVQGYWISYMQARWYDPFFPFRHPLAFFWNGY